MRANNGQTNPIVPSMVEDNLLILPQRYPATPEMTGRHVRLGLERDWTHLLSPC